MVSDIAQWQNPGYGLSICTWLRLDALESQGSAGSNYRRLLFKYVVLIFRIYVADDNR